jgi:hypothetical protein
MTSAVDLSVWKREAGSSKIVIANDNLYGLLKPYNLLAF